MITREPGWRELTSWQTLLHGASSVALALTPGLVVDQTTSFASAFALTDGVATGLSVALAKRLAKRLAVGLAIRLGTISALSVVLARSGAVGP
ncbi:hypothetical protein [Nocardioides sp. InS609-2]|uniref:hypothetical protein n=1 Tax=Nocardioides sp. InS609-2 TaxID=2760705 RepID=UPI0020C0008D|nr:hypothetical protein [Nocardioides sp. InS609-2]